MADKKIRHAEILESKELDSKTINFESVTQNAWQKLNAFTDARVGLGRSGVSVPTQHLLDFQLAHAKAQDAVHKALDVERLKAEIVAADFSQPEPLLLHSQAVDRATYLQRPDYGRFLDPSSSTLLEQQAENETEQYDLAIVVVDGLSALAIEQNTLPFLTEFLSILPSKTSKETPVDKTWHLAPISIVKQGRVAIGDDICQRLKAKCVLVLIGERPGLSSPDSLGLYLTWSAKVGLTDAYRNCISNVRPAGLDYKAASRKTLYLLQEARARKLSGVQLKDQSDDEVVIDNKQEKSLLIPQNG